MANRKQIKILKQGAKVWNKWRESLEILPDLKGANLRGADLSEANLRGADLSEANLSRVNLERASLGWANLEGANLRWANLSGADLENANLEEAKLEGADLEGASVDYADLSKADLRETNLTLSDLVQVNLREANLREADLSKANLRWANLSGADLEHANLEEANLSDANLSRVCLKEAYLGEVNLREVYLKGANLEKATMGRVIFGNIDLSEVKGLETVRHMAPSIIGIDTIIRSRGKIPEVFLKGCGVPESFIENIPALLGAMKPIDFNSCFISYTNKDLSFAKNLYHNLQVEGVRCWFAPHDMKIGDKMRPRIDESIRIYDKLLLILSRHSVTSQWVEHEVETALGKELEGKPNVLFPIRLDDAVMESKIGWASHIKLTRHIGDFTKWSNHEAYLEAFNRLLRDLKAASIEIG